MWGFPVKALMASLIIVKLKIGFQTLLASVIDS